MQIIHHGAVNGVTGSCHQLIIDAHHSVLVDCGLFQGAETAGRASADLLKIEFDIATVKALIVTHCHIDHVGRIPYLLAAGFNGPIYATTATAALLPLVLEDAIKVGVSRDRTLIQGVLTRLKQQLVAVPYKCWQPIPTDASFNTSCKIKFQPAGHILGSAYVEIDAKTGTGEALSTQRVVFSGDLGATYAPLLAAPRSPYQADVLVIESTYGDKNHEARKNRSQRLQGMLSRAIADNGVVLIPAFSIGRTQELLYEIEHMLAKLPASAPLAQIEVIVDSPMAAKFTQYYREFKDLWDAEARKRVAAGRHPLSFESLYTIDSHEQHLATINYLRKRNKPAIVIAASGMCSGGRIVNYLKAFLAEPTADILFVGYQARGTLGYDIQKYGTQVPQGYVFIDGKRIDIKATVQTISGYSAHAGQDNLVNFVRRIYKGPKEVVIVHGDNDAKQALAEKLAPYADIVRIGKG